MAGDFPSDFPDDLTLIYPSDEANTLTLYLPSLDVSNRDM